MFVAGLVYAFLSITSDVAPHRLPSDALRVQFWPHFSQPVLECLAECPGLLCAEAEKAAPWWKFGR